MEHLRSVVLRLYRLSTEHPEYFALMFVDRTVPRICREYERLALACKIRQELIAELEHAVDEGVFPRTISPAAAFRIPSMGVLGVAVMRLSGRLIAEPADACGCHALCHAFARATLSAWLAPRLLTVP